MSNDDERNVIREALELEETKKFGGYLHQHVDDIKRIIAHHFRLNSKEDCEVSPVSQWKHGGFNISIPVHILSPKKKLMFRCPMAHKLAEIPYPGTVNEKSRAEVATKIWLRRNCPSLSTAHLYGFQYPDGRHFTRKHVPLIHLFLRYIRRCICKYMKWEIPSWYLRTNCAISLRTGYIIEDFLDGTPLTPALLSTYDAIRRQNLFRGIAEMILTFARTPVPRIGSWTFNNDGTISLTNRPLSCSLIIQENEGAERVIQPGTTYSNAELYISDVLSCHDNWFMAEPNAVIDAADCRAQLGARSILRAVSPRYFDLSTREGPFIMGPTDFNLSNLLVDDWGNIKHVVDQEFYCALPLHMCYQLRWLSGMAIDQITGQHLKDFNRTRLEFLEILRELEAEHQKKERTLIPVSEIFEAGWEIGRFWFAAAVMSVNASYNIFHHHICEQFSSTPLNQRMYDRFASFSSLKSEEVVQKKVADRKEYERRRTGPHLSCPH